MDLQQIKYFLLVMKCSSFTEAARQAYTTQPNISKNISSLEQRLGCRLFTRTRSGVEPTREAILLEKKLSVLLLQFDSVLSSLESQEAPYEYLQVGFCENMSLTSVAPDFFQFFREIESLNDIRFVLHCLPPKQLTSDIISGKLDLAFLYSTYPIAEPEISVLPLTRFKPRIYYSDKHELAREEHVTVESFRSSRFVKVRGNGYNPLADLPYAPSDVVLVDSLSDINLYVETGTCVTVLGPSQNIADRQGIHYLEIATSPRDVGADAVWRKRNENPALIRTLPYLLKRTG